MLQYVFCVETKPPGDGKPQAAFSYHDPTDKRRRRFVSAIDPQRVLRMHARLHTSMSHAFAVAVSERWPKATQAVVRYGNGRKYRKLRECFRNERGVDPDAGRY